MTGALLEVRSLTKHFGGVRAVDGLELTVTDREIVGLIGPNGAGKTTVFNMLSGTLAPTAGKIIFAGRDITGWPAHRICAAGMARTFQVVRPFRSLTVIDNVLVGATVGRTSERDARRIAEQTLDFVGLAHLGARNAGDLSLIDLKRLEVARALAARPRVLLLDEVFAGLTPRELPLAVELVHAIRGRGVTLIVIEHLMQVIMNLSDRVVVLHHGQELAVGSPREIVEDPAVVEAYLGTEYRDAHGL